MQNWCSKPQWYYEILPDKGTTCKVSGNWSDGLQVAMTMLEQKKANFGHYLFHIDGTAHPRCDAACDKADSFTYWNTNKCVGEADNVPLQRYHWQPNAVNRYFLPRLRFVLLSTMCKPPATPPLFWTQLRWDTSFPLQVKAIKMRLRLPLALYLYTELCCVYYVRYGQTTKNFFIIVIKFA